LIKKRISDHFGHLPKWKPWLWKGLKPQRPQKEAVAQKDKKGIFALSCERVIHIYFCFGFVASLGPLSFGRERRDSTESCSFVPCTIRFESWQRPNTTAREYSLFWEPGAHRTDSWAAFNSSRSSQSCRRCSISHDIWGGPRCELRN
jgi:hypothetical protein